MRAHKHSLQMYGTNDQPWAIMIMEPWFYEHYWVALSSHKHSWAWPFGTLSAHKYSWAWYHGAMRTHGTISSYFWVLLSASECSWALIHFHECSWVLKYLIKQLLKNVNFKNEYLAVFLQYLGPEKILYYNFKYIINPMRNNILEDNDSRFWFE